MSLSKFVMSVYSEYIQDVATEDLLDKFGSDPKGNRRQQLFYKDGEMFIKEESHSQFPRQSSFTPSAQKGELLHSLEASDTAVLCFYCYSEEEGEDTQLHRIRSYKLFYHLADCTFSMNEPVVENSGMIQGRVFRHQQIPSDSRVGGPFLHWRDLNLGMDVNIFGKTYRVASCDNFTKTFLEENGIKLNAEEEMPEDPWLVKRRGPRRYKEEDRQEQEHSFVQRPPVMSFRCCWLDSSNDFHGCRLKRIFRLTVFSVDDTVTLTEETKEFEGQLFLRRIRLPMPASDGVRRFYRNSDFRPGIWIDVFCRPMFIYECVGDETKQFMTQQFGEIDFRNCSSEVLTTGPPPIFFDNTPEQLLFHAKMIDPPSMLYGIDFLLTYHVNTRTVTVVEAGTHRKWSPGRSFLTDVDASTYSENQFVAGRVVQFFKWRFLLVEGDRETNEYLKWKGQQ